MKRLALRLRQHAEADLIELVDYFAGVQPPLDEAFIEAVVSSCERLTERPLIGTLVEVRSPRLKGLRRQRVSPKFADYLIFYLPSNSEVDVVRVLHGARDLPTLLQTWRGD